MDRKFFGFSLQIIYASHHNAVGGILDDIIGIRRSLTCTVASSLTQQVLGHFVPLLPVAEGHHVGTQQRQQLLPRQRPVPVMVVHAVAVCYKCVIICYKCVCYCIQSAIHAYMIV